MRRTILSSMVPRWVVTVCVGIVYLTAGVSASVSGSPTESGNQTPGLPSMASTATLAAPSQPVYDPAQLGDLGTLDGYVMTSQTRFQQGTQPNGGEGERISQVTLTVINVPRQAQMISSYYQSATADRPERTYNDTWYWAGEVVYKYSREADFWTIQPEGENETYYFNLLADEFSMIQSARFVGQEDFQGVPANHFVFELADLVPDALNPLTIESAQGNLFLAQDGNYPLHLDYRLTGNVWWARQADAPNGITYLPGAIESVYDISSINQVTEIVLPEEVPLQVELNVDVPLPTDARLSNISVSHNGPPYVYTYQTDLSDDEILAFYQAFQPTNGWTLNTAAMAPTGEGVVVVLMKDGQLVVLGISFNRSAQKYTISFSYPPG